MQILILSFHYPPDLTAGALRVAAFARALSGRLSADDRVHVVAGDRIRRRPDDTSQDRDSAAVGASLAVHRGRTSSGPGIWLPVAVLRYAFRAWRVARRHAPKVVVGSSSKLGTAVLAAAVATASGARLHLDFRDLFTDHLRSLLPPPAGGISRRLLFPFKRWAVRRAATVSATNAVQARYLRRYFGARCTVISNGVEPGYFEGESGAEGLAAPDGKLRMLYAGNLGRAQALHRVVPALAASTASKVQWRIIGNGPRAGELKQAVAALENVEMLEPVSREALLEHYDWADALFLHLKAVKSSRRVVPSKIFEYAATGKPILAGVSGISRKLIQREVEGAWCFRPENVSEALQQLGKIQAVYYDRGAFRARYDREMLAAKFAELVLRGV